VGDLIQKLIEIGFIEDAGAAAQMKRIMGDDLVLRVWTKPCNELCRPFADDGSDQMELQYNDMIVELVNGNKIFVWTSEWGGVDKVDHALIEKCFKESS
jgi:hypothetical protein